jgi:hypothetical protein
VKETRPTKVLTVRAEVADSLRKVASAEGLRMSAFLDRCLQSYLYRWHPDGAAVTKGPEPVLSPDEWECVILALRFTAHQCAPKDEPHGPLPGSEASVQRLAQQRLAGSCHSIIRRLEEVRTQAGGD